MFKASIEDLDDLTDDQLWEVAGTVANDTDTRNEALERWLFPAGEDDVPADRMAELRRRATILEPDEVDEYEIEDVDRNAPYFDGEGRLIVEYEGVKYLIDTLEEN